MRTGQDNGDLRASLAVSQAEARTGTKRVLTLPTGRTVEVTVPPGTFSGQEIRIDGEGLTLPGRPAGALILTVTVVAGEQANPLPTASDEASLPTIGMQLPPTLRATPSSLTPSYPSTTPPAPYSTTVPGGMSSYAGFTPPPPPPPTYTNTQPDTNYPNAPYNPANLPPSYYAQAPAPRPRPRIQTILLALIAIVVIVGAIALYAGVYIPNQQHAQATATVLAQITGTANAQATTNAQINATTEAQLNATGTAQAQLSNQATATVTAYQNIYNQVVSGTPALSDAMTNPDTFNWDTGSECFYSNGAYHVKPTNTNIVLYCTAENTNFTNFVYRAQMNIISGSYGGLIFRANGASSKFYLFYISQDGSYALYVYVDNLASHAKTLASGTASTMHQGFNQNNEIAAYANGNAISLYVNGSYLTSVNDGTLSSGQIGVIADGNGQAADVAYSKVQVWRL
jgi:hypothetical protein